MSGRGYHLVFPLPRHTADFPDAIGKAVLREEHGWYEILLDHWVTFTRKPIPTDQLCTPADNIPSSLTDLYASLAVLAKPTSHVSATALATDDSRALPMQDWIIKQTITDAQARLKSTEDFNNDMSRWEFSTLSILSGSMHIPLIAAQELGNISYSDSDEAWLLYRAALLVIPHRSKHDTTRNGRPFLLDRAASLLATRAADM